MKNEKEITTIFVNPVPRTSVQGRHKQVFTIISSTGEMIPTTSMQKNREFGVASHYQFPFNAGKNRLETGLDVPVDNIFKGMTPTEVIEKYSLSQDWLKHLETVVKQDQIKKQTLFEILDNVAYNFYTNEIAGNATLFNSISSSNKETPNPNYLQRFSLILYDKPNRFTDDTPRGRLCIQLIKVHSKIAKSKTLINSSLHDWYVSEENEAVIEKMKRRDIVEEAVASLFDLKMNSTPFISYKVASLLTNNDNKPIIKGTVSDMSVKERLSDYISDGNVQMSNIEKFLKLYKMLKEKESRAKFEMMYLIQQGFNTNVLKNTDGYLVWNSKAGTPNMYKHSDYNKFLNLIIQEYLSYNPEEKLTNWYKELYDEVLDKKAWLN